jgi:hypothetical protein
VQPVAYIGLFLEHGDGEPVAREGVRARKSCEARADDYTIVIDTKYPLPALYGKVLY